MNYEKLLNYLERKTADTHELQAASAIIGLHQRVQELTAERDGLLKSLVLINPSLDFSGWENGYGEEIGQEINAAIASVKEK